MSRIRASWIAAGLGVGLSVLGSATLAQAPGGWGGGRNPRARFGRSTPPIALLSIPEVRKDLKVTNEQMKKIQQAQEDSRKKQLEQFEAMRNNAANGGGPP